MREPSQGAPRWMAGPRSGEGGTGRTPTDSEPAGVHQNDIGPSGPRHAREKPHDRKDSSEGHDALGLQCHSDGHPGIDRSVKACAPPGPPSGCARMSRRGTVGETATRWALKLMHILRVSGPHPSWDRTRSRRATGVSACRDCGRSGSPHGILVGPSPAPSPGTPSVLAGEAKEPGRRWGPCPSREADTSRSAGTRIRPGRRARS